eukprot:CAMPEP_0116052222 /NCGR_PEP_ID=MMETSP0322-20121206/1443_1 /TAXON_ID=163516 /ORGANISM="Leptocylindrus danicus var. apora, Strain B651" /LENGTH=571 /DNA_ID=CAMNT_0003535113 /DNA_START=270 /DNA_END=1982 /DNA_ORIENTATION=-
MFGKRNPRNTNTSTPTPNTPTNLSNFDPSGLERAAKAARELDASPNATAAYELLQAQERTHQHTAAAKRAEYEAYVEQQRSSNIAAEAAEARTTLEAQTQHERHRSEYQDELERKRQVDLLQAQKYMQEEQLKKQEEMLARQEAMRRKTAEQEAALQMKMELAKVEAQASGRIRQERTNHDLIREKLVLEASEYRETVRKGIADAGRLVGEGVNSYLDHPEQMARTAYTITGIAVGVYAAKMGVGVLGRFVERQLGKPSLVRETSRWTVQNVVSSSNLVKGMKGLFRSDEKLLHHALEGVVLEEGLASQLRSIAVSTANTKKNGAPFRHVLLHGPPGTGKTLFAKNLARHSGLDYAILTGGDVAPLGRDAVTELHNLFDWADSKGSKRGLLVFVDEADAFLQSRNKNNSVVMSEDQRNALNAFLYRTGTETNKFMMVYASNQPSQFDEAVTDRIDEMVEFVLPDYEERKRMIAMYMDKYLIHNTKNSDGLGLLATIGLKGPVQIKLDEKIDEKVIEQVVQNTDGFSGRAISKLAIAWQAAAYGNSDGTLSLETFLKTVDHHKHNMQIKEEW